MSRCQDAALLHHVRPQRTSMTFWSKNDPVRKYYGTVDHWTKLRARAAEQANLSPYGTAKTFDCFLYNNFDGHPPGEYHLTRPQTVSGKNTFLRSAHYRKAKAGFKYWQDHKIYPLSKSPFVPAFQERMKKELTQPQPDSTLKNQCHEYMYMTPWE